MYGRQGVLGLEEAHCEWMLVIKQNVIRNNHFNTVCIPWESWHSTVFWFCNGCITGLCFSEANLLYYQCWVFPLFFVSLSNAHQARWFVREVVWITNKHLEYVLNYWFCSSHALPQPFPSHPPPLISGLFAVGCLVLLISKYCVLHNQLLYVVAYVVKKGKDNLSLKGHTE